MTMGPRYLFGTSSPRKMPKESWPAAERPLQALAPINISTLRAHAPMMQPMIERPVVPMTTHLRPNMSDKRPTRRKPMQLESVQMVATQLMFGEFPRSALMIVRVLAGNTQPRYAIVEARHCA